MRCVCVLLASCVRILSASKRQYWCGATVQAFCCPGAVIFKKCTRVLRFSLSEMYDLDITTRTAIQTHCVGPTMEKICPWHVYLLCERKNRLILFHREYCIQL